MAMVLMAMLPHCSEKRPKKFQFKRSVREQSGTATSYVAGNEVTHFSAGHM
jgi:hypothetical protein